MNGQASSHEVGADPGGDCHGLSKRISVKLTLSAGSLSFPEHVILTDEGGKDLVSGWGNEILPSTALRYSETYDVCSEGTLAPHAVQVSADPDLLRLKRGSVDPL
jgi:hypothetical protein